MRSLLLVFAAFTSSAFGLHIDQFYYHHNQYLEGRVTWDPSNPGASASAEMTEGSYLTVDEYGSPVESDWFTANGGVAFLDLFWCADGLRFETWGTDTNGAYGPDSIDIFTLPILAGAAFVNCNVDGPLSGWTYTLSALADNPYGFRITAGSPEISLMSIPPVPDVPAPTAVPDQGPVAAFAGVSIAALLLVRRRLA